MVRDAIADRNRVGRGQLRLRYGRMKPITTQPPPSGDHILLRETLRILPHQQQPNNAVLLHGDRLLNHHGSADGDDPCKRQRRRRRRLMDTILSTKALQDRVKKTPHASKATNVHFTTKTLAPTALVKY